MKDASEALILSAVLDSGHGTYSAPTWLRERAAGGVVTWRVVGLDAGGEMRQKSVWRKLTLAAP